METWYYVVESIDGDSCCASAACYDLDIFNVLANNFKGIHKSCKCDNCCAVLIIMEDRDVTYFFELLFDLEASWS